MTRAGYTVASGFTLLYVVTACCADNDSTPIPCRPLSHSGAVTPVLATAFAPHAFLNLTMNQFDARQRYVEDLVGPPTFLRCSVRTIKLLAIATAAGKASTFNTRHTADPSVGGGLLPIAVDQSAYPQLTLCHREQAPTFLRCSVRPIKLPAIATAAGKASTFNTRHTADPSVGGGLLPIAVDQSAYPQLTHCHREQAPSHLFTVQCQAN